MRRCFQRFAAHLDARHRFEDPEKDLESLGVQYLAYAQEHPLEYRLMFSTTWPDAVAELDLLPDATHAFDVLRGVLRRMHGEAAAVREAVDIWSTVHGLAGVMNGQCIGKLDIKASVVKRAVRHAMDRMAAGLAGER
jgi:hypothetical protein